MLASYVLSRTLVPTLVMWFYRNSPYHGHGEHGPPLNAARPTGWSAPFVLIQRSFERGFASFRDGYRSLLAAFMACRGTFALCFLAFCLGSLALVSQLGQDFFPKVDGGQFRLHLRARSGTRIEESARLVERVHQVIREVVPAKRSAACSTILESRSRGIALSYSNSGVIGTGDADILVSLTPEHGPTDEYVRKLRVRLNQEFPSTMFYFLPADIVSQTLNLGLPAPFDVQIYGRDQAANRLIAARLADKIRRVPGAVDIRVQQPADQPKLTVKRGS
jgi:multidrug efflux pump subunit AcrB